MADLLISPIFDFIFENLTSAAVEEVKMLWNVVDEVDSLSNTLSTIRAVLEDAEEQQITSMAVKDWLRKLKDVAYDADDVLDDFATQAAQAKIKQAPPKSSTRSKQVKQFFTCCFFASKLLIKHEMGSKMNKIRERLDKIERDRHFHLNPSSGGRQVEKIDTRKTSSFIDEVVVGRDDDKKKIIEILMSDESNGNIFSVLPIIGMGGQGKTTLAQLVYNDKKLESIFEVRAWVCVSDNFDVLKITNEIIESITKSHSESLAMEPMQRQLSEMLTRKRFLIILDDVWSENPFEWERLRRPFFGGASGSKIIVTTRSEKVTQIMGTIPPHCLKHLSQGESWSLFERIVFGVDNLDIVQEDTLIDIGKKIVGKCRGLPLAIKSLGGILSTTRKESIWKNVLESKIWQLPESNNGILPALRLSYHHLPANLKQCFAYCALFPKDFKFDKDELVKLWMGAGYIQPRRGMEMEEVGEQLFDDLLVRSFFSRLSNDDITVRRFPRLSNIVDTTVYNMHDLVHDLAEFVSKDDCLRIEAGEPIEALKDVRHLSFIYLTTIETIKLDDLYRSKSLQRIRTFIHKKPRWSTNAFVQLGDSFEKFSCLRVLSLNGYEIKEIPYSIGNLKHLRYLDLSCNHFERLPNSICSLYNLQTLILKWCDRLIELPKETMDLINLQHLQLDGCDQLTCLPPKMGKLTRLRDLSKFIVGGEGSECTIVELKHLVNLGGEIEISNLENVANREEAEEADLKNKKHLEMLILSWDGYRKSRGNNGQEEEVLEGLQPHINLKELTIDGYMSASLPSWLLQQNQLLTFSNLQTITFSSCKKCQVLVAPLWKLSSLRSLYIKFDDEVEFLDMQNFHSLHNLWFMRCSKLSRLYPPANLRILCITSCDNLEALPLDDLHNLSSLNGLMLDHCPNLATLPEKGLPASLNRLILTDCPKLASLPEKGLPASLTYLFLVRCPLLIEWLEKEKGEDWHKKSHIPDVIIG